MGSEPVAGVDPSASIVDVLIIGGGLAGVCAATAAVRQGFSVTLVSAQDRHPPDFRGEKLGEHELRLFEKVGVGVAAYRQMEAFDGVWTHRFGHLVDKLDTREYSSDYSDLVNALRDAMPTQIDQIVARVAAVTTSEDVQTVTLGDGRTLRGRLLVVATGLGDSVRRMVGVEREIVRPMHSLCCGFDLVEPPSAYPFISLVWSDERIDRTVSYLSLFPMGGKVRGNLFIYRRPDEAWTRDFRADPTSVLHRTFPLFERRFGTWTVDGPAIARPVDLVQVRKHEQPGLVLIGDAFSVVCPSTGTGVGKVLIDVDRLCNHYLPQWLATAGMGLEKIAAFYADPVKTAFENRAWSRSQTSRDIKLAPGLYWNLRRLRSATLGRARLELSAATHRAATLMSTFGL
jgi:2-polyprenyl-6-methoxyphenol hydroxylase-like FAD-dependent oxidoreductase